MFFLALRFEVAEGRKPSGRRGLQGRSTGRIELFRYPVTTTESARRSSEAWQWSRAWAGQ